MASNQVWIVLQQREGKISRISWEAVAAGQQLAAALGGTAEAVLLGSGVGDLAAEVAEADLAAVHVADHENLGDYTPGAYVGALAPAVRSAAPAFVVFPHTYQTVDYFARLAQEAGAGLLPEITAFEGDSDGLIFRRPIMTGKMEARVRVRGEGTVLCSVQSGSWSVDDLVREEGSAGSAKIHTLQIDAAAVVPDREILGVEDVAGGELDLTKSERIVAVGRGVGGADKMGPLEELAAALGAELAASRPVVDNGWLPRERQIGSSGQTVAPKLYLAAGISGAIQHVVGMKGATTVVAINKDPGAPIFQLARYGIVGDLHEIVPALTEAVKAAKG